jgi:hypothetical protein
MSRAGGLTMKWSALASRLVSFGGALLLISSAEAHLQGHTLDDAQCSAAWAKASPDGKPVSFDRVEPYVMDYNIIDEEGDGDGSISFEEFKSACFKGNMRSPDEVARAMEVQKPPPTPADNEYERLKNYWNAAGAEARQRFLGYIGK